MNSGQELTGRPLNDVHKLVFLINEYPGKTMIEIAQLFQLPAIDTNNAIWRAEDMGYLLIDDETQIPKVENLPTKWEFGEEVETLRAQLLYYLKHIARDESDIEQTYLANVLNGYLAHDQAVVMKWLLGERVIASYELTDTQIIEASKKAKGKGEKDEVVEDVYTFFSLWENSEQQWGKKQFKDQSKVK